MHLKTRKRNMLVGSALSAVAIVAAALAICRFEGGALQIVAACLCSASIPLNLWNLYVGMTSYFTYRELERRKKQK